MPRSWAITSRLGRSFRWDRCTTGTRSRFRRLGRWIRPKMEDGRWKMEKNKTADGISAVRRLFLLPSLLYRGRATARGPDCGNVVPERLLVGAVRKQRGQVGVALVGDLLALVGGIRSRAIDGAVISAGLRDDIDGLRLDGVGDRDALEHDVHRLRHSRRDLLGRLLRHSTTLGAGRAGHDREHRRCHKNLLHFTSSKTIGD